MDLDGELDGVDIGNLGPYTVAATTPTPTGARVILDQHNYFRQPEKGQKRTMAHEFGHVKQFNNSLDDWMRNEFNVSDEFAEELGSNYGSVADMEGEIEAILDPLFPGQKSSYPYWKFAKEREWGSKGLDVESELVKEMEEFEKEILSEYREVYSSEKAQNFYTEAGNIDGTEYLITVQGPGAGDLGEEIAEDYLEGLAGDDYEEGLAGELEEYIPNFREKLLGRYTNSSDYDVEYGKGENGFDNPVPDDVGVVTPEADSRPEYAETGA